MRTPRKLAGAFRLLSTSGPKALVKELRLRLGRSISGRAIGDHFPQFAVYRHSDGEIIPLYAGYRDFLKPLHVLAHATPAALRRFVDHNCSSHIAAAGLGGALNFVSVLDQLEVGIGGKRILDVGCGDGALAFLLAACGGDEVHGIEIAEPLDGWLPDYQNVLLDAVVNSQDSRIVRRTGLTDRVKLFVMDIQRPTVDGKYDLIVSNSVLEHVVDLRTGLTAMTELLAPGGIMVHVFNPFFSENGGHEWCILDFPWAHVRLTRAELIDYLATYRAWEQDAALTHFDGSFNDPKLTLKEIDAAAEGLGLHCRVAGHRRSYWWTPDSAPERILAQCRRTYPRIAWSDLIYDSVTRVWSLK
jgi:SAM-dependent methyltransferase